MKKFFNEFKEFISKGNVMDMAIGVIIATAFGKITTSLVNDVFMAADRYAHRRDRPWNVEYHALARGGGRGRNGR